MGGGIWRGGWICLQVVILTKGCFFVCYSSNPSLTRGHVIRVRAVHNTGDLLLCIACVHGATNGASTVRDEGAGLPAA